MTNQLIVAFFVVFVVLTQQSFAYTYQHGDFEETGNSYDLHNNQAGIQDYSTANTEINTQDQSGTQHQDITTGQNQGESHYLGSTSDSGFSYGQSYNYEQGATGTNNQDGTYSQDNVQNQGTGIGKPQGGSHDLDVTQNPGSSDGHHYAGTQDHGTAHDQSNTQDESDKQHQDTTKDQNEKETLIVVLTHGTDSSYGYDHNKDQTGAEDQDKSEYQKHTEDLNNDDNNAAIISDEEVSSQESQILTAFKIGKLNVMGAKKDSLNVKSDGKNVTVGFISFKFAQAILDNVTVAQYADVKTSDGILHRMAYLLKSSDSNGFQDVLSSD